MSSQLLERSNLIVDIRYAVFELIVLSDKFIDVFAPVLSDFTPDRDS